MIICKYKRTVSKNDKPFQDAGIKEFKTSFELEARKVIQRWNDRGKTVGVNKIIWRYDFI